MGMGSIWDRRMGMVILVVSEVIQKAEGDPKIAQDDLRNSLGRPVGVVVRLVMSGWQGECPEMTLHGPMTEGARGPVRPQGEGCGCSDWCSDWTKWQLSVRSASVLKNVLVRGPCFSPPASSCCV